MPTDDAKRRLTSALQRFRRRLRLRAFVLDLPVSAALATAVAAAVTVTRSEDLSLRAWAASLLLAILAAYLVAVIRTPSLAATAQVVDRELRLQDRAVSALQFSESTDSISRLVVAEGAARLEDLPASRLPLTFPVTARWLAIGTSVLCAAVVLSRMNQQSTDAGAARTGPATATASGGTRSPRDGVATPDAPKGQASVPPASSPGAAAIPPTRPASAAGTPSAGESSGRGQAPASKPPADPSIESGSAPLTPESTSPNRAQAGGAAGGASRGDGGSKNGTAALTAGGRGAGTPGGREDLAGGAGGTIGGRQAVPLQPNDAGNRRTAAYDAAYNRAEAATAAERVPFALRSYVRAYFLSIRPASRQ